MKSKLKKLRLKKQDLERALEEQEDRVTMTLERMKKAETYTAECQIELGKVRVENSELDKLMRENSESPSSDDDEHRGPQKDRASVPVKKRRRNFGQYDVPATTISVLVIACWTLRLPVTYMDLVRFVVDPSAASYIPFTRSNLGWSRATTSHI